MRKFIITFQFIACLLFGASHAAADASYEIALRNEKERVTAALREYIDEKNLNPLQIEIDAKSGDPHAEFTWGSLHYLNGNIAQAAEWWKRAALSGDSDSAFMISEVIPSEQLAPLTQRTHWVRLGAYLGNSDAQHSLADSLMQQVRVKKMPDFRQIYFWLSLSESSQKKMNIYKNEYTQLKFISSLLTEEEINELNALISAWRPMVVKSEGLAAWLQKQASSGGADDQYFLGQLYESGILISRNMKSATDWYKISSQNSGGDASFKLGQMFASGEPPNWVEAQKWFSLAAEQDNSEAAARLGILYFNGLGVDRDLEKAFFWLLRGTGFSDHQAIEDLRHALPDDRREAIENEYRDEIRKAADAGRYENLRKR